MNEPPVRHSTAAAINFISQRLGLRNEPGMQDWEFEVAEAADLNKYLTLFAEVPDKEDVRFTLADFIIQAFEESDIDLDVDPAWKTFNESLGRVDKRDFQVGVGVIQAGICYGEPLGPRPYVRRGVGVFRTFHSCVPRP